MEQICTACLETLLPYTSFSLLTLNESVGESGLKKFYLPFVASGSFLSSAIRNLPSTESFRKVAAIS